MKFSKKAYFTLIAIFAILVGVAVWYSQNSVLSRDGGGKVKDTARHSPSLPGQGAAVPNDSPAAKVGPPSKPADKIAPNLKPTDAAPSGGTVVVNVTLRSPEAAAGFVRRLSAMGGRLQSGGADGSSGISGISKSRFLRVELPVSALNGVSSLEEVLYVEKYEPPKLLNDRAANIVGARVLGEAGFAVPSGLTGAGQLVAVADTGLDTGDIKSLLPDFKDRVKAMVNIYQGASLRDSDGHGTHVAGTIAGSGSASDGRYKGMAPGAALYVQSIIDGHGDPATPVDLQALFSPAYKAGARIHVNSWGSTSNAYLASSMQVDEFVRTHPDFLVLFGAGNSGPDQGTIGPEANSKNALVVGASENPRPEYGRDADDPGQVADLSSRGPTEDGRIKPELVAPGTAVVSTASTAAKDQALVDKYYTRKSGTSMATAVTAGAAALLREYLVNEEKVKAPTAALMKAALINGADSLGEDVMASGFGRLNVLNTVLALKENTMQFEENKGGIAQGGTNRYTFDVKDVNTPFKATLAWSDPPSLPGSPKTLVNDLDLLVIGPKGHVYYGNDFNQLHRADRANNVEQVAISLPEPGKYTVQVIGHNISTNALEEDDTNAPAQDYALVYGSQLEHETVARADEAGKLLLLEGDGLLKLGADTPLAVAAVSLNSGNEAGEQPKDSNIKAGADLYFTGTKRQPNKIYAWYSTDAIHGGVKGMALENGGMLSGLNGNAGGGYSLAAGEPGCLLYVNGKETQNPEDIIMGSDVEVTVNPSSNLVWEVNASYSLVEGYLQSVDKQKNRLQVNKNNLALDPNVVVNQFVNWKEQIPYWLPFSYSPPGNLDGLSPGKHVKLVISPATGNVTCIESNLEMVVGILAKYDEAGGKITLASGQTYELAPGAKLQRDGEAVAFKSLQPGDHLEATILPDSSNIWSINAYSKVMLGQVVFYNEISRSILVFTEQGQYTNFTVQTNVPIYWQGRELGPTAVREGDYVRLALTADSRVWRIDVATADGEQEVEKVFNGYDQATGYLTTSDGQKFLVTPRTAVLRNGVTILPGDLIKGEKIKISAVLSTISEDSVLAFIKTESSAPGPELNINAPAYVDSPEVKITGTTDKTAKVRLYMNRGSPAELPVKNGSFAQTVTLEAEGTYSITLVALDPVTGGLTSQEASVYWSGGRANMLDIKGHWAANQINDFIARGIVRGYPDGLFRPDAPITRVDFVRMAVSAFGWKPDPAAKLNYTDLGDIRRSDRPMVAMAAKKGLIQGYPGDNTFRPDRYMTRAEMAVIIYRALQNDSSLKDQLPQSKQVPLPDEIKAKLPQWAQAAVKAIYNYRIMYGREVGGGFEPAAQVTRAEAVQVLWRILQGSDSQPSQGSDPAQANTNNQQNS